MAKSIYLFDQILRFILAGICEEIETDIDTPKLGDCTLRICGCSPVKRSICALVALGKSFSESTSLTGCGSITISSSGSDSVKYVGMRRRGTDGAVTSF